MRQHSPQQQFKEAVQIAKDHGMFVVDKGGNNYLLYRKQPGKNVYLGKRSSSESLRTFVCRCADFH